MDCCITHQGALLIDHCKWLIVGMMCVHSSRTLLQPACSVPCSGSLCIAAVLGPKVLTSAPAWTAGLAPSSTRGPVIQLRTLLLRLAATAAAAATATAAAIAAAAS